MHSSPPIPDPKRATSTADQDAVETYRDTPPIPLYHDIFAKVCPLAPWKPCIQRLSLSRCPSRLYHDLSGPYRAMRAAMRCEWRRVLNTEKRCDAIQNSGTKIQPKEEVFSRISLWTSGQKLRSGPPNPGKTSIFGTDIPRGRPWKNVGLKKFGLIFRSLKILAMRVLAAEILCDATPRCENTSDAMPRCRPLRSRSFGRSIRVGTCWNTPK